jgi:hypothetical protein
VRIGSAVKGVVLVVIWPVTGLAGGAVPSRAPGKYGGSTQGVVTEIPDRICISRIFTVNGSFGCTSSNRKGSKAPVRLVVPETNIHYNTQAFQNTNA